MLVRFRFVALLLAAAVALAAPARRYHQAVPPAAPRRRPARIRELGPLPRGFDTGGAAVLRGRLLPPYTRPKAMATDPGGHVSRLDVSGDAAAFTAPFRCAANGIYQVELIGEDRFGDSVLANFP